MIKMFVLKHEYASVQDVNSQKNTPLISLFIMRHKIRHKTRCSFLSKTTPLIKMFVLKHIYTTVQDVHSQTNTPLINLFILRYKYASDQDVHSQTQIRH